MREARERRGYALYALMVTDILAKDTDLYVAGDAGPLERAFGTDAHDGVIALPGRDEPQEAGRAEGSRRPVIRVVSIAWPSESRRAASSRSPNLRSTT